MEISDEELRKFLDGKGLDPKTAPYFCAQEIRDHYELPMAEAQRLVDHLM